jgi:hypothetical protein
MVSTFFGLTLRPFLVSVNHPDQVALKVPTGNGQVTPVIDRVFPPSVRSLAIEYVGDGHVRGMVVISI